MPTSKTTGRTVRDMKETIRVFTAGCWMILGNKMLNWPDEDYARFGTLADMTTQMQKQNPTHKQHLVVLVAWGRFFKSIIDRVPLEVLPLQDAALKLYNKAIEPYAKWFEESEKTQ